MTRRIVIVALGSALYAGLALINAIPGFESIRPAIAVVLLVGVIFGPGEGFAVGLLGALASDLVTDGFYWNWALASGLIGLVAGLASLIGRRFSAPWTVVAAAIVMGVIGVVLAAALFALSDVVVANLDVDDALGAEGVPILTWGVLWGIPLMLAGLLLSLALRGRKLRGRSL